MEGFKVGKNGTVLDSVQLDVSNISLLSRGDGTEVMLQFLEKDKLFYMYPADNSEVMEFCYILTGKVVGEIDGQKMEFGPHEYFSVSGIKEPVHFEVLTDTSFIWVSTEPVFVHLSKEISALMDIVKQVEKKDRYTYNHGDRVVNYSIKIAKKMKLSKVQLENLNIAASLHDIGKVYISEEILNKPTTLTDEEFNIIKKHPLDGAEMLKGTVYEEAYPILAQHHERLNGSGYPNGLKGEEILLEARIIAVSDTFDAMTEDRSYRKAFNAQFALDEIKGMADTHYDRKVVEAFEEVLKEEGIIK
ncbi:HD-GYP domain-containing protein [Planococcus sp. APC 3906]|uniref:HD-GYP domain-containing protein n=1 Tax=Planococcus sp. APC 3906 TaxID=3035194 RepID=UPI0025B5381C|nr:HD-GYP domain-containing protein [Planococcus sp. APC 3906]MDN3449703.1 HD-GYP domain-containing protein [Planococcus sp. APC 3906]